MTAPLLEASLTTSASDASTPDTGIAVVAMCDIMLGLPAKICTQATGQGWGAMGTGPRMKAGGDDSTEFREGPISHVQTDKMGLPKLDYAGPMLKEYEGPGVFCMHVHTSGGGKVRPMIETPVVSTDAAA